MANQYISLLKYTCYFLCIKWKLSIGHLYINQLSTSICGQFITVYQSRWKKRTETKKSAIIIRDWEREKNTHIQLPTYVTMIKRLEHCYVNNLSIIITYLKKVNIHRDTNSVSTADEHRITVVPIERRA